MKYFILILCVFLCACDTSEPTDRKPDRIKVTWLADGSYRLVFRFDKGSLPGLIDEKVATIPTHNVTLQVVEYFHCDGDWVTDVHAPGPLPGFTIDGTIYAAEVTGANLDGNEFGVLPASGTFATSTNIADYWLGHTWFTQHPIAGIVLQRGPIMHTYRTEWRADGLLVTWDGVDHWFPS